MSPSLLKLVQDMRKLVDAATKGPAVARHGVHYYYIEGADGDCIAKVNTSPLGISEQRAVDAKYIAAAYSNVPTLLDELEKAWERIGVLEAKVKHLQVVKP